MFSFDIVDGNFDVCNDCIYHSIYTVGQWHDKKHNLFIEMV